MTIYKNYEDDDRPIPRHEVKPLEDALHCGDPATWPAHMQSNDPFSGSFAGVPETHQPQGITPDSIRNAGKSLVVGKINFESNRQPSAILPFTPATFLRPGSMAWEPIPLQERLIQAQETIRELQEQLAFTKKALDLATSDQYRFDGYSSEWLLGEAKFLDKQEKQSNKKKEL